MTVKQFYEVSEFDHSFCLDFRSEEVLISKEDKALIKAFGDIVIDGFSFRASPRGCLPRLRLSGRARYDRHGDRRKAGRIVALTFTAAAMTGANIVRPPVHNLQMAFGSPKQPQRPRRNSPPGPLFWESIVLRIMRPAPGQRTRPARRPYSGPGRRHRR